MRLGWVDFSREERRKITSIIKLLGTQMAVDEIGIGTIRDGFSELLFPGSSTVQTRAKYFVLVPQIFALAEKQKFKKRSDVAAWVHKQEDELVRIIKLNGERLKDKDGTRRGDGVIGFLNEQRNVGNARKPSDIYWNGLKVYAILRDDLSFSDVCGILFDNYQLTHEVTLKSEDAESGSDDDDYLNNKQVLFTPIPHIGKLSNLDNTTIKLTRTEAEFLYERITDCESYRVKSSLIRHLLLHPEKMTDHFWEIDTNFLPDQIMEVTQQAQEFSDFIYGAHVLYNIAYSEANTGEIDPDKAEKFKDWRKAWRNRELDVNRIRLLTQCDPKAATFVQSFYDYIKEQNIDAAKELIKNREKSIKKGRAKNGDGGDYKPVHDYRIEYRYRTVKQIINDILEGLE